MDHNSVQMYKYFNHLFRYEARLLREEKMRREEIEREISYLMKLGTDNIFSN